jgi:hypothetical protein
MLARWQSGEFITRECGKTNVRHFRDKMAYFLERRHRRWDEYLWKLNQTVTPICPTHRSNSTGDYTFKSFRTAARKPSEILYRLDPSRTHPSRYNTRRHSPCPSAQFATQSTLRPPHTTFAHRLYINRCMYLPSGLLGP